MVRLETSRRREAVEAERARAQENLELQKKAQEAALAAQEERARIAREIHDGVAQSMYALSLSLETCADLAERRTARSFGTGSKSWSRRPRRPCLRRVTTSMT